MNRGPVEHTIIMVPMMIQTQREDDHYVAVLPAWQLPILAPVTSSTYLGAVEKLQDLMRRHWSADAG